jgi:hypothetical protein
VTAGRRIRAALMALPGRAALYSDVVVAGVANDYLSYFATPEEYGVAQYEGSFTLFGPQSTPLLQQELAGLAQRMIAGTAVPGCLDDPAFCSTHLDHPDISALATPPTPLGIDQPAQALRQPVAEPQRLDTVEFVWRGGSPSAEWLPDADHVQIERLNEGTWEPLYGDAMGTATLLRYEKSEAGHVWTAQWEIPLDEQRGTYRFHIHGAINEGGGRRTGYDLYSDAFKVFDSNGLRVFVQRDGNNAIVTAGYPLVDPALSYRLRPRFATDGIARLTVDRSGSTITLVSPIASNGVTTIALAPGDVVLAATVIDAAGNVG